MRHITAFIITIGDELLIGQVIDTNSAWIAQQLNKRGIWIGQKISVGDDREQVLQALEEAEKEADIIIITGGLGPTKDDLTKEILCNYFEGKLVLHKDVVKSIEERFAKSNTPLLDAIREQAMIPDVCKPMQNTGGTAPGMLFEKEGKLFFSMPGVPHEMKAMVENFVIPEITKRFHLPPIQHRTIVTLIAGESLLAERLKDFEAQLPSNIKLAYLPSTRMVRLRLTEQLLSSEKSALDEQFEKLKNLVADVTIADEDIAVPAAMGKILLQKNKTVASAESCTGGYLAHLFTSVAGASQYFYGSVVSYVNSVKENVLGVKAATLARFTAVSEETVKEMAQNVRQKIGTNYAVATTGIFGPDGGTPQTPVGTVWIAVASERSTKTQKLNLPYTREQNTVATAMYVFDLLRRFVSEDN